MAIIIFLILAAVFIFYVIYQSKLNERKEAAEKEIGENLDATSTTVSSRKFNELLDSVNTIKYCMIFFVVLQVLSIIGGIIFMSQIGSLF